ncbi:stage V sporulation protein B [Hathewaya proteolytica DSM 3090]|uniref:Stage V sporulation protein B n=1 Tax=Hathewaya proteolytica DSM 3090 TaxID=1121331 RepID=A0A1M6M9V8_9CLOT|nr:polysaccharide biosynthesis protein [Hathewaya proteolytica]SHJ80247.1 stage V sporulation protein B [Hathewaya proteolytica DSM 3090]
MKKQTLIKGTLILGMAGVFARFLGLFFRIPMQILLGDEGMGYYQMSYPLYMTFIAVSSGIPIAVSKIISEMSVTNDICGMKRVVRGSFYIMIPIAAFFSIVLLIFAKSIILYLNWDMRSYYALIATAMAPIFVVIMGVYRGFFQGLHNMTPTAVSQILEQIGRVLGGVALAYIFIDRGLEYSAGGAALGALVGAVIGLLYLLIKFNKSVKIDLYEKDKPSLSTKESKHIIKKILKNAVPFSFGSVIGTIMSLVDSIIVPSRLVLAGLTTRESAILYGQLTGKASTISNVPLALSMAVCTTIVPIIAEAYVKNNKAELKNKIETSIKMGCVISIPSAMGLFFLAFPVINLIFRGDAGGYEILKYMAISIPFIVMTQCTTTVLQATNNFYEPIKNLTVGCAVKIVLTYVLTSIPNINIYGAVIGSTVGYIVTCILNMRLIKKRLDLKVSIYKTTIKPMYAATFMSIAVILSYKYFIDTIKSYNIACIGAILVGIIVYGIFIFILDIVSLKQVKKRIMRNRI